VQYPVQRHQPQQEIKKKAGLSVQAPSSSDNDTLKADIVVRQIMTELSKPVSEQDKIMVITKMVLNLIKQNGLRHSCFHSFGVRAIDKQNYTLGH
jgi:hypothetical protein